MMIYESKMGIPRPNRNVCHLQCGYLIFWIIGVDTRTCGENIFITIDVLLIAAMVLCFTAIRFDATGFQKCTLFKKDEVITWESIYKAEHRVEHRYGGNRYDDNLRYVAIYTNEHFLEPTVLKRTRTRKAKKNEAIVMLGRFEIATFRDYLEKYRPDLFIERDVSAI
ncbi:MAG: hypothetical protein IJC20_00400 [Clostridia bacterium]|nr:hypothetical protein [Clostridia bacterium]